MDIIARVCVNWRYEQGWEDVLCAGLLYSFCQTFYDAMKIRTALFMAVWICKYDCCRQVIYSSRINVQGECEEVYPCSIFHKSFVWNM